MFIVFGIILAIAAFFTLPKLYESMTDNEMNIAIRIVASLLVLSIGLLDFFSIVPPNSVGILYSPISGTREETLPNGIHPKNPLDKVYSINTEVQNCRITDLTVQTKDSQWLNAALDVKYYVNTDNAYLVFKQFKSLENVNKNLIEPTTQRVVEKITTTYEIIDILGEKRGDLYAELERELAEEFLKSGIAFHSITIIDMDGGTELEKAIEAEAVAKKSVQTAKEELEKTKIEAQKELERTKVEAEQKLVEEQANQDAARIKAETKVIEAQAEKDANDLLKVSLSEELLRQAWIEKWDGHVPTYYGSDSGLILDMSN